MPTTKAERVVIHTAGRMSAGVSEPKAALRVITDDGMIWIDAVLIITNIHIASLALAGDGFILSRRSMAESPRGVAAFPIPSRFADIFMHIFPRVSPSFFSDGKIIFVTGDKRRAIKRVIPDRSVISITPDQKHMSGAIVKKSSAPFWMAAFSIVTTFSPPCVTEVKIIANTMRKLQIYDNICIPPK